MSAFSFFRFCGSLKKLDKYLVVMLVMKYLSASSSPVHHMVPSAMIFYSEWTCHAPVGVLLQTEKQRRNYTAEQKVAILKEHLVEGKPLSDLCDAYDLHPTVRIPVAKGVF